MGFDLLSLRNSSELKAPCESVGHRVLGHFKVSEMDLAARSFVVMPFVVVADPTRAPGNRNPDKRVLRIRQRRFLAFSRMAEVEEGVDEAILRGKGIDLSARQQALGSVKDLAVGFPTVNEERI